MPYGDDPIGPFGGLLPQGQGAATSDEQRTPQTPAGSTDITYGGTSGAGYPGSGAQSTPQTPQGPAQRPAGTLDLDIESARKLKEQLDRERQAYQDRLAPGANAATIDTTATAEMRQRQLQYLQQLQAAASGHVPSAAEISGRLATDRGVAQQFGMAAALQGGNAGGALRQASMGGAALSADMAGQMMAARAAEQVQARGQLGQAMSDIRGADFSQAAAQGQFQQQANLANLDAKLKQMGMDDARRSELLRAMLESQGQSVQGGIAQGQRQTAMDIAKMNDATARRGQSSSLTQSLIGGLLGAGGAIGAAALSDARQKQNIVDSPEEAGRMLEALHPKSYEYRDASIPGTAPGKRYGILAQDLEKSPMGKSLVRETPHGKMIDVGQATGAMLAALAELNQRVKKVEGR